MDTKDIVVGVALILVGLGLTFVQIRSLVRGRANTLGGASGLLICGIACIISGIILIAKHL